MTAMFLVGVGWLGARNIEWMSGSCVITVHQPTSPTFQLHRGELRQRLDPKFRHGSEALLLFIHVSYRLGDSLPL